MVYQEMTSECDSSAAAFLHVVRVVVLLALSGCAAMEHMNPIDDLKVASQGVMASMRKQGEKMVRTPEQTREKYACAPYSKTMFQLEEVEVLPGVVTPGKEINQRIRYAYCPLTPSGTLKGKIIRAVLFKGEEVYHDTTDHEFKPGTWTVDVFIGIPREAASGVYALDLTLRYAGQTLKESNSFVVKGP
jgi:hypothetical protein